MYRSFGKRVVDVLLSTVALLLLWPLIGLTAALVRLKLGTPVLFRQQRPGLHGKPFELLKFRTMTADSTGGSESPLSDAERLTPFGKFLRSTSLDELPEFLNVLRGDMSLVGPRPLLMRYLPRYSPEEMRRHEVRPGITGWAQVTGRNNQSWPERFAADIWYVDHVSFVLDLKILVRTVWKVIAREGITAEGHATIPEFMGSGR